MKKYSAILALCFSLSACAEYPGSYPFVGGIVGGTVGAATGATLCGYNPACMVVGSVAGAMVGGAVGNAIQPRPPVMYMPPGPPPPQYVPGVDPAADAAYNIGHQRYQQNLSRERQAAAFSAGVRGY